MTGRLTRIALPVLGLLAACGGGTVGDTTDPRSAATLEQEWFVDAAKMLGLDFVHFNGLNIE
jgi:hypothetical protein